MAKKFKAGDVTRVKKDLVVGKRYGDYILYPALIAFIGEKVVINEITWQGLYACYCETKNNWDYFSPKMLEPVSKAKEYILIVTDNKVIILDKENKKKGISTCHEEDVFQFEVGVKLAWDRLHGIKQETPKPQLTSPEFNKCVIVDDGLTLPAWKSEAEKYGITDFSEGGHKVDSTEVYDVAGFIINPYGKKVYIIRGKNGSKAVEEGGIKLVEYKLYDCDGVELKEDDEVYNIALDTGNTHTQRIELVNGILYNSGLNSSHRADRNNGKYNSKDSLYKWKVLKK